MKKAFLLSMMAAATLLFNACESDTIDFDTNLKTTILSEISQPAQTAPELKVASLYPFTTSKTLSLSDNKDVEKYLNKLKDINVKSIKCSFSGIPEGQSISDLTISVPEANVTINVPTLTNNTVLTLNVTKEQLTAISNKLLDELEITIVVSGKSTYAPMTLSSALDFATSIKAKVLDL
jgi:hypothetical protein